MKPAAPETSTRMCHITRHGSQRPDLDDAGRYRQPPLSDTLRRVKATIFVSCPRVGAFGADMRGKRRTSPLATTPRHATLGRNVLRGFFSPVDAPSRKSCHPLITLLLGRLQPPMHSAHTDLMAAKPLARRPF